jgi:hypothetical protein
MSTVPHPHLSVAASHWYEPPIGFALINLPALWERSKSQESEWVAAGTQGAGQFLLFEFAWLWSVVWKAQYPDSRVHGGHVGRTPGTYEHWHFSSTLFLVWTIFTNYKHRPSPCILEYIHLLFLMCTSGLMAFWQAFVLVQTITNNIRIFLKMNFFLWWKKISLSLSLSLSFFLSPFGDMGVSNQGFILARQEN